MKSSENVLKTLNRAVELLAVMRPDRQADWSIAELREQTGCHPATLHRWLSTWMRVGFVTQDPATRRYRLGIRLMELGLAVWQSIDIRRVALPAMRKLATDTQQSSYLTIRDGFEGVLVEKVDSPAPLRQHDPIGMRFPLHVGCSRRVLIAYLAPDELAPILENLDWRQLASGTITTRPRLLDDLAAIRRNGYGVSFSDVRDGTAGIAAPVWDHNEEVIASLMATGVERDFRENGGVIAQATILAAREVTRLIGGHPRAPSQVEQSREGGE
ncbi:MAG TPA: IclR family transcriptional regulator [bacterium]|nr:IclR family transcriptional regulator [bacterium]